MAIQAILPNLVGAILGGLVQAPAVPVERQDIPVLRPTVERIVEQEVAPVIEHLTNNEPWYQSRVTLGAIASIASGLAGIVGWQIGAEDITTILVSVGPIVGGALALYGRWKARKPLGA